jgi:hypothetical protein
MPWAIVAASSGSAVAFSALLLPLRWLPQFVDTTCCACTEYRLSRLYGTSTADPLVQKRTRTIIEATPKGIDLAMSPLASPSKAVEEKPQPSVVHPKPFIPVGPIVAALVRPPLSYHLTGGVNIYHPVVVSVYRRLRGADALLPVRLVFWVSLTTPSVGLVAAEAVHVPRRATPRPVH